MVILVWILFGIGDFLLGRSLRRCMPASMVRASCPGKGQSIVFRWPLRLLPAPTCLVPRPGYSADAGGRPWPSASCSWLVSLAISFGWVCWWAASGVSFPAGDVVGYCGGTRSTPHGSTHPCSRSTKLM